VKKHRNLRLEGVNGRERAEENQKKNGHMEQLHRRMNKILKNSQSSTSMVRPTLPIQLPSTKCYSISRVRAIVCPCFSHVLRYIDQMQDIPANRHGIGAHFHVTLLIFIQCFGGRPPSCTHTIPVPSTASYCHLGQCLQSCSYFTSIFAVPRVCR
jgi:hypothetical protein